MKTVKKTDMMLPAKCSVVGWRCWCLWIFLGLSCLVVTVDAIVKHSDPCHLDFSDQNSVKLCNNASTLSPMKADTQCTEPSKGLVLMPLVLAPQQFYTSCLFFLGHLYNATCLGRRTHQEDEYDRVIFGILDTVSGQNRVPAHTQVEQFPVTVAKDGVETQGLSAFVIFKKLCRAADPERLDTINMCSNQTKNGTHLSLTLRGLADVPDTPSLCRCVIRPASQLKLSALDVRLQNSSNRQCGRSALKIETNGSREDILRCHKMSALYGNKELYTSNAPDEVTLTLTYISKEQMPTSVWISAQDKFQEYLDRQMSISCGGFLPLPTQPPEVEKEEEGKDEGDGDGHENGEGADEKQSEEDEAADAGTNTIIIAVAVAAALLLIILIAVFVILRRRCTGSYSGVMPACSLCCQQEGDDDLIFYKAVTQQEPVYAEPGKPRPSATSLAYTYPADAKFPLGRSEYAEPDPNGSLGLAARATTPPPIPEVPPPGSAPVFPPGTPPPKPERTLLRRRKESGVGEGEEEEEDYDHIVAGGKTPLKSPRGRDGQNNIIGDGEGEEGVNGNLYDCLQHGEDYSQIGEVPKQQVKDNVYDTTA